MSITNVKIHWNTPKICLFGQTTKESLRTLSPENLENTNNFESLGVTLVTYRKEYFVFQQF